VGSRLSGCSALGSYPGGVVCRGVYTPWKRAPSAPGGAFAASGGCGTRRTGVRQPGPGTRSWCARNAETRLRAVLGLSRVVVRPWSVRGPDGRHVTGGVERREEAARVALAVAWGVAADRTGPGPTCSGEGGGPPGEGFRSRPGGRCGAGPGRAPSPAATWRTGLAHGRTAGASGKAQCATAKQPREAAKSPSGALGAQFPQNIRTFCLLSLTSRSAPRGLCVYRRVYSVEACAKCAREGFGGLVGLACGAPWPGWSAPAVRHPVRQPLLGPLGAPGAPFL
jgi:hypothetical protein